LFYGAPERLAAIRPEPAIELLAAFPADQNNVLPGGRDQGDWGWFDAVTL
jgi:hypothetical protein